MLTHSAARVALLLSLVAIALDPAGGLAQSARRARERSAPQTAQEARRLFESGSRAFQENRFEAALLYFEQANQIAPRAELLYNIGRAAEEAQQHARATEAYREYLAATEASSAESNSDTRRSEVTGRLAVLEAQAQRAAEDPTPIVVAQSERSSVIAPDDRVQVAEPSRSVTDEGWFWPVVLGGAALVAGGVVLAVVLTSNSGAAPTGDDGIHTQALSAAPLLRF